MTRGTRTRRRRQWFWLVASLFISLTLLVPLSYMAIPHLVRYLNVSRLTSDDLAERELGLNYLIRTGPQDPRVAQAAIHRLDVPDRDNFVQIVAALDRAGLWSRDNVPARAWLRWLAVLASDDDPEAKIIAGQHAAELHQLVGEKKLDELLTTLLSDDNAEVRYNALIAVGRLWGQTQHEIELLPLLVQATQDDDAVVAQHAWVLIGLTRTFAAAKDHADWASAPEPVAMTMLYAATVSNPDNASAALAAFQASRTRDNVRAFAAYCLGLTGDARGSEALYELLAGSGPADVQPHNRVLIQRAWLGITPAQARQLTAESGPWAPGQVLNERANDEWFEPIVHVMSFRAGTPFLFQRQGGGIDSDYTQRDALTFLAACEGRDVGQLPIPVSEFAPELLQLAVLARTPRPAPKDFTGPMRSDNPHLRDLACHIAAERLNDDQLVTRIQNALASFHDSEKMSGAILAGLTGLRPPQPDAQPDDPDLLTHRFEVEDVWVVKQVMGLGLWMQGRLHETSQQIPGLLSRDDVPRSTVMLAMLHQRDERVWDALYRPLAETPPVNLYDLLVMDRWWHVLTPYNEPRYDQLWLWADPDLQAFQIETLRSRRLVHPEFLTRNTTKERPNENQ